MGSYVRNKFRRVCRLWVGRSYNVKRVLVHGAAVWEQEGGAGHQRLRERHKAGEENQVKQRGSGKRQKKVKREKRKKMWKEWRKAQLN